MRSTHADRGFRVVTGRVNQDGSISQGTADFRVIKNGTGDYSVILPGRGALGGSAMLASGNPGMCSSTVIASSLRVFVYTIAGALIDQHFTFTASVLP